MILPYNNINYGDFCG